MPTIVDVTWAHGSLVKTDAQPNKARGQAMTAITFPTKTVIARFVSFFSAVVAACANFCAGAREGREIEARYDALARKSPSELAQLGLTRQDIARAALTDPNR